jgi:hypothetical protein
MISWGISPKCSNMTLGPFNNASHNDRGPAFELTGFI